MARANAAIDTSAAKHCRTVTHRQAFGHIAATMHDARYDSREATLRLCLPYFIAIFLAILCSSAILQARDSRDAQLAAASAELDLLASLIAADFRLESLEHPDAQPNAVLARLLPRHDLGRSRRVIYASAAGEVLATAPEINRAGRLADLLDSEFTALPLPGKPDVSRWLLEGEGDRLTSVRKLIEPLGQIILIQPLSQIERNWWIGALRSGVLLASAALVLAALCAAYLWQSARLRELKLISHRLRTRVDTALSRGRCGLWDWDIGRGRLYWSDSMYEMLGMHPGAMFLSINELRALAHPEETILAAFEELLQGPPGQSVDNVFRLRDSQGEWKWLRVRAQVLQDAKVGEAHIVGIAVDVTEAKRGADAATAADLRVRDAIETLSDAFVVWDADAKPVLSNSKFRALADAGLVNAGMRFEADGGKAPDATANFEAQGLDGRWFQFAKRATKDGGMVSVGRDFTDYKVHEAELLASESKLTATISALERSRQALETQAQQLAEIAERYLEEKAVAESANLAKAEFLANMSHELRTPLNAIIGFSEMMENEVYGALGNERYTAYASHIRKSGDRLLTLVTDILDMSRLESRRMQLHKGEFRLAAVIRECLGDVAVAAKAKNIRLRGDGWGDATLNADRAAIERVLKTLVGNAVKFTSAGGRVSVRARLVADAVNIYVEDSGAGIPHSAIGRIGRPFVQVENKLEDGMKGSGLRLAIARSLVELHGGAIRIQSVEGSGTLVMVHLPGAAVLPAQLALATA